MRGQRFQKRSQSGQSIIEYSLILSIVLLVILAMSPAIKRSTQGMIKVVADQVGVQQNGDQVFDRQTGHLIEVVTTTRATLQKQTQDTLGVFNYTYGDVTFVDSTSLVNLGSRNQTF